MWKPIRKWNRYRSLPGGEPLQYAILFFAVLLGCWPWFRWYDGSVMVNHGEGGWRSSHRLGPPVRRP